IRAIVAIALPLALAAAAGAAFAHREGHHPLTYATAAALLVFGARLLERALAGPVRRVLAPRGGRLLDAVDRAVRGVERTSDLEALAETTLGALRERAIGVSPWLMIDEPDLVFRVDAAGLLRRERRALPAALFAALRGETTGPLLLRELQA